MIEHLLSRLPRTAVLQFHTSDTEPTKGKRFITFGTRKRQGDKKIEWHGFNWSDSFEQGLRKTVKYFEEKELEK